ncbi:MAG TPA: proline--tRNA ligase, partial [Dehalococcoidia bacterium]|nr:proline--tRNA ligase [Dehalococcoidia bacterium]
APADATNASHILLSRAGYIRRVGAGIYDFLPLGYRVLRKIEAIVRQEMDATGGQEVHLPVLSPGELWAESGRLESMGEILMTLTDRRERTLVLGPTHEEVITDLVRREVHSYRDLPLLLYQIQTKFRDEPRPRGGLLRSREFLMKDAYSFDADWEGLDRSYESITRAYARIFARCGVPVLPVQADSGAIGGKESQEFLYLTDVGEDEALICAACGYAANREKATFRKPAAPAEELLPLEEIATPGQKTIDDLARFLGIPASRTLKAVFMLADGQPLFVAVRGDMQVNETKLQNALHAVSLAPMDDAAVTRYGLVAGSAGPAGLRGMRIVADEALLVSPNLVTGANKPDVHVKNVNYGRDWQADIVADIARARAGDACLECGAPLAARRGLEMGHVFKLGTVYSEAMQATFLDSEGESHAVVMGCYGIGVTRLLAALIEANHDERGIVWPLEVAPYAVYVVVLNADRPEVRVAANKLYAELQAAGLEPLMDDREESAGVKFNDADLLGMPLRLTLSPRNLQAGAIELKLRAGGEPRRVPLEESVVAVREALTELRGTAPPA